MVNPSEDDEKETLRMQTAAVGEAAKHREVESAHPLVVGLVLCFLPGMSIACFGMLSAGVYFGSLKTVALLQCTSSVGQLGVILVNAVMMLFIQMFTVVVLKQCCFSRFEGRSQLWSYPMLRWVLFGEVIDTLSATVISLFQGTAFLPFWLRLLGATVGEGVYYDTWPVVETDCLSLGDGCVLLQGGETFVPHTIDRGMLQFAPIRVGASCSVGLGCCLLPMTELEDSASLGPLSLMLKGEVIPRGKYGEGSPVLLGDRIAPATYAGNFVPADDSWCGWLCGCCFVGSEGEFGSIIGNTKDKVPGWRNRIRNPEEEEGLLGRVGDSEYGFNGHGDSGTDDEDYW